MLVIAVFLVLLALLLMLLRDRSSETNGDNSQTVSSVKAATTSGASVDRLANRESCVGVTFDGSSPFEDGDTLLRFAQTNAESNGVFQVFIDSRI